MPALQRVKIGCCVVSIPGLIEKAVMPQGYMPQGYTALDLGNAWIIVK